MRRVLPHFLTGLALVTPAMGAPSCTLFGQSFQAPQVSDAMLSRMNLGHVSPEQRREFAQLLLLRDSLRQAAERHLVALEGIHVNEADVEDDVAQRARQSLLARSGSAEIRRQARVMALAIWHAHPDRAEEAYREVLAPVGISRGEWDWLRELYANPSDVERLSLQASAEDSVEAQRERARSRIARQALMAHLVSNEAVETLLALAVARFTPTEDASIPDRRDVAARGIRQALYRNALTRVVVGNMATSGPDGELLRRSLANDIQSDEDMVSAASEALAGRAPPSPYVRMRRLQSTQ